MVLVLVLVGFGGVTRAGSD
ncbi:Protein of unknown function [Pyronema omphalodes CBS 100304]|uniref:Uncharacterized protein n=1 Tax=Pyronema omphalodes (strain CBS 100304) TaxID=1076935 RepID=U4LLL9_PYROM|nr:Protein of unknown function [Pyronema omphalodes CBS 100304]